MFKIICVQSPDMRKEYVRTVYWDYAEWIRLYTKKMHNELVPILEYGK